MTSSSKPTFVLFPGAFHVVDGYAKLKEVLEKKSYPCLLSKNAPSLGINVPANTDLAVDVAFFRNQVILPLLDEGKELVLVLHSYAGASVGGAVQGLTVLERQNAGLKGGVMGIVCMSTINLAAGLSIQDTLQMTDELAPWTSINEEKTLVSVTNEETGIAQFYSKLPLEEAQKWAKLLQPQAIETFKTKAEYAPWTDATWNGKLAYLLCEDDPTFPLPLQQFFVQSGNFKFVETIATCHSPFLELPNETADFLIKFAASFQ